MFDRHHSRKSRLCRNPVLLWAGTGTIRPAMRAFGTFDAKAFEPAIGWARKHERKISALSLAGGFAFDSVTFGRIDHALTQAVFIIYLLVAGIALAVLPCTESRPHGPKPSRE